VNVSAPYRSVTSCRLPAAVDAVWLPWPLASRADLWETKLYAPTSLLLQIGSWSGCPAAHTPSEPLYGLVWV